METKKIGGLRVTNEPLRIEFEDGSYFVLAPINALKFIMISSAAAEDTSGINYMKQLFAETVQEAQIADFTWKRGDDIDALLEKIPAAIFLELQNEVTDLNNLRGEQRAVIERAAEIQEKK
jgi:hypothetical protein